MIKGIIFDLDGVYFKNGTENFLKRISSGFNLDIEKVKDIYLRSDQMQKYKEGILTGDEFWDFAIKQWQIPATKDELLYILVSGYELNQPAVDLIKRVRNKGIKSVICSNNFKERIAILDRKFNFLKDFDYVILSYEHGIRKPSLLDKVPEITKFKAHEILVLDDSEKNINGAIEKGFQAALCYNPDNLPEILKKLNLEF
ncbi:HAD hydrolase-like protein [Candidatus Woesearchaeota archaeon]|nr:HAD hydrolase-like protein [Candidatus Woesearchaeota archaeon]